MPEIPEIGVQSVTVPEIPSWRSIPPQSIPNAPPITLQLGFPMADIPGCVETRNTQPGNSDAYDADPKGNLVVCDGTLPSYRPLDFTPGTLTYGSTKPPIIDPANLDKKESADVSSQPTSGASPIAPVRLPDLPKIAIDLPCPPPDAIPLGAKNKSQTAVIIGYKVIDGECEAQTEVLPVFSIVGNYLPGAPVVITTATIAATATVAAIVAKPLGDFVLKAVKPIVKKTIKKIKERIGKKVVVESVLERQKSQRSLRK